MHDLMYCSTVRELRYREGKFAHPQEPWDKAAQPGSVRLQSLLIYLLHCSFCDSKPCSHRVQNSANHQIQHQVMTQHLCWGSSRWEGWILARDLRRQQSSVLFWVLESFLEEEDGQEKEEEGKKGKSVFQDV